MFRQEAQWLSGFIYESDPAPMFPMLDLGSLDEHYRTVVQPHVDELLFAPARARGLTVVHSSLDPGDGVDLPGDLTDPAFLARLSTLRFNSVLCTNLLNFVPNLRQVCGLIQSIVNPGGYILITTPYRYSKVNQYDTGFRPDVRQLAELFPQAQLLRSETLSVGTGLAVLWRCLGPRQLPGFLGRALFHSFSRNAKLRRSSLSRLYWLFREEKIACVILKKPAGELRGVMD